MPGADQSMILRRPMMSMYLSAMSVKMKFVPETMSPTAVGWSNPISLNSVAISQFSAIFLSIRAHGQVHTAVVHELFPERQQANDSTPGNEAYSVETAKLLEGLHATSDD